MPFSGRNDAILCFRRALALDEHRVKFRPFFYPGGKVNQDGKRIGDSEHKRDDGGGILDATGSLGSSGGFSNFENRVNSEDGSETDVLEVFFAGVHCGMLLWIHVQPTRC